MTYAGLLNQTVSIYNKTGLNVYGKATTSTATSYSGRVQEVNATKLMPDGESVNIDLIVFLASDATVTLGDKIVYNSISYKVMTKKQRAGRNGAIHHLELECTSWVI